MAVRSGRFTITNPGMAAQAFTVINSGSNPVYRFFNSGASTFKIKRNGSAGGGIPVDPKNSIDAEVKNEIVVIVEPSETVEGIYDYVETRTKVRNGRFSSRITNTKSPTIIFGRSGSFYRIFNSGDVDFLLTNGISPAVALSPRQSLDIVVEGVVKIGTSSATPVKVEAIYDYLAVDKAIRSGRFKRRSNQSPASFHQIVDFREYDESNPYAMYRIYNSGDNEFEIIAQGGGMGDVLLKTLGADQSFDFGFNRQGFDANKTISVRSTDATKGIEGIYEFLGFDD